MLKLGVLVWRIVVGACSGFWAGFFLAIFFLWVSGFGNAAATLITLSLLGSCAGVVVAWQSRNADDHEEPRHPASP